jgi:hypothetical protein
MAFAKVVVEPSATRQASPLEPLRLRLAGQRELILPATMPFEQVARLIHTLEATA